MQSSLQKLKWHLNGKITYKKVSGHFIHVISLNKNISNQVTFI